MADLRIIPLLKKLRITSKNVFEDENFREEIKEKLQEEGYDGFDEDNDSNAEEIWRVLARAVDSSVRVVKYVDLRDENSRDTEARLKKMLSLPENQNLSNCNEKAFEHNRVSKLKSPKDMANKSILGIKKEVPLYFVTNLIEQQFANQWNTNSVNGVKEPDDFNFYTFCDVEKLRRTKNGKNEQMEGKTKHLKYNPRRAHVEVQLYRFCRANTIQEYSVKELCPRVYIRLRKGWKQWHPSNNTFTSVTSSHSNFSWMHQHIYEYISSHAIKIKVDNHEDALDKPTLYWAVVDDTDFQPGPYLKLNEIGKTQVYVGKAENGIIGRWLKDGNSHCKMMKNCLENVQEMTTYDPLRVHGIQLVDARILLAKLRRDEECALFVMKTYDGPCSSLIEYL